MEGEGDRNDVDKGEEDEEEAERQEARRLKDAMRTPLQEMLRQQRKELRKRGKPQLTEDILARIGEMMTAKKQGGQQAQAAAV
mgnify:CR=1 FL=1